jgi:hypothetical protein
MFKWQIVDLRLHQPGDLTVPFGTAPDHSLRPDRVLAQFADRRMVVACHLVGKRHVGRIEDPHLGTEEAQQAPSFLGGKPGVGTRPQRAVKQQDSRGVLLRPQSEAGPLRDKPGIERRQMVGIIEFTQTHGAAPTVWLSRPPALHQAQYRRTSACPS